MRLSLWLILILAFSIGMCCALAVRTLYFEAALVVTPPSEPTTKILVAKRTIPSGIEITADFVVFQEVPLSEVPIGSLTSFAQVYRRQPAYPIPADCPVCEDLLCPPAATVSQAAFVPTGNQIVAMDVVHVRQKDRVFSSEEPLSAVLSADQRVDIRLVLPESQGKLAEKRNQVLRNFVAQDIRNSGELILENVPIHQIRRQIAANHTGSAKNFLEFMLDKSEATRLTAAAKRGQIRIFVRQNEVPVSQPTVVGEIVETADSYGLAVSDTLMFSLSPAQSLSLDILPAREPPVPIPQEPDSATQSAPSVDSPAVSDVAVNMSPCVNNEEIVQNTDQQNVDRLDTQPDTLAVSTAADKNIEKTDTIRNDGMITFGNARSLSSDASYVGEQDPARTKLPPQTNEPVREIPTRPPSPPPSSEVVFGPRINRSIQFLPPSSVAPAKESPQEPIWQVESTTSSQMVPLVIPSAMPVPIVTQEKVPAYSPFERRVYTVLPSEDSDRTPRESLSAPQRLFRNSESGTP